MDNSMYFPWGILVFLAVAVFLASRLKPAKTPRNSVPPAMEEDGEPSKTAFQKIRQKMEVSDWGKPLIGLMIWVTLLGFLFAFQDEIFLWDTLTSNFKVFVVLNLAILAILLAFNFGGWVARSFFLLLLVLVIWAGVNSGEIVPPPPQTATSTPAVPKANVMEVKTIIAPVGEWSEEGVVVKEGPWSCFPPKNTKVIRSDGGNPFDDGPGVKNNTGKIKVGTILWYKSAGNKPVVVPCFNVDTITARPPA